MRKEKLIVRVGGGWLPVEEFLRFFAEKFATDRPEVRKTAFQRLLEQQAKGQNFCVRRLLPDGTRRSLTLRLPSLTP